MHAVGTLVALSAHLRNRRQLAEALKELRRKLHEERKRYEHRRLTRIRHYATLDCIPDPETSGWMKVWLKGTNDNFIHYTSLDRPSFMRLLREFARFYSLPRFRPKGGRSPRLRFKHQALAVVLVYYVDSLHARMACSFFGVPPATLSRVLNAAKVALSRTLSNFHPARITWPSPTRQRALAKLTALRQPLLQFTWGFIDGKNFKVLQPSNPDVQNAFYNGWLHDVFVTGTLCFGADGLIVWDRHNCPGSRNDAENCVEFRDNLLDEELCPDKRYGVVADSAFPCSGRMTGRILTPLKKAT